MTTFRWPLRPLLTALTLSVPLLGCSAEHVEAPPSPPPGDSSATNGSAAANAEGASSKISRDEEIPLAVEAVPEATNGAAPLPPAPFQLTPAGDRGAVARKAQQRLRARFREMRTCYDQAYLKNAQLAGTVVYRFTLLPTGGISQPENVNSTLTDPDVLRCVSNVIIQTKFDPFKGKGTRLLFPIKFVPPTPSH